MIFILDQNLDKLRTFDLPKIDLDSSMYLVISIDISQDNSKILLGTISSQIYEIVFSDGSFLTGEYEINKIQMTHNSLSINSIFANEITAIINLKNNNVYISVGEDWSIRVWDNKINRMSQVVWLDNESGKPRGYPKCLDVNEKETHICVGFREQYVKVT